MGLQDTVIDLLPGELGDRTVTVLSAQGLTTSLVPVAELDRLQAENAASLTSSRCQRAPSSPRLSITFFSS